MINWSVLVLIFFKWIFCLLVLEKFDRNIVLKYGLYVVKIIWWVVILCLFIMSVILDNFLCCFILFNIFKIFLGRDFLMIIVEVEFIVVGMKGKSYDWCFLLFGLLLILEDKRRLRVGVNKKDWKKEMNLCIS